jgi:hypothetical protein
MRKLRWAYQVSVEYKVAPGYETTVRFPRPWWFILALTDRRKLDDGGRVTVL